jgi:peptidoglycan L-alanyl-D-glutamate endopeptidase CwlK
MEIKKDKVTLERIKLLHPSIRAEVSKMYDEFCAALSGRALCRFAYTLRTIAEQDALYAQGRPNGKKVTNAKGGQSYHNYGLAFDIVLLVDKDKNGTFESASWETNVDFDGDGKADWQEVVQIAKSYGWTWGGDWKFTDMPHFEKTFGYSVKELESRVKNGIIIPNTLYPTV